jgi:hypothetical protein
MSSDTNLRIIILWISIRLLAAKLKRCSPLGTVSDPVNYLYSLATRILVLPRNPGCENPISLLVFIFIVEIDQALRLQVFGSGHQKHPAEEKANCLYIERVSFGAAIWVVSLTHTTFDFCRSIDVSYNTQNAFHRNISGCSLVSLRHTSSPFWQVLPLCSWSLLSQFAFQIPWTSVHFAKSHTAHPTARTERKSLNPVFSLSLRLITHC